MAVAQADTVTAHQHLHMFDAAYGAEFSANKTKELKPLTRNLTAAYPTVRDCLRLVAWL
jgi:hypothetical protein